MIKIPGFKKKQKGSSMVEIVLVVVVIGFLALLVNNLPSSIYSITRSKHTSLARDIASKELELLRQRSYDNLEDPGYSSTFTDTSLFDLPEASANYRIDVCPLTVCTNEEEVKQLTVRVEWKEQGDDKSVELVTLISKGGI